jgi:integrase
MKATIRKRGKRYTWQHPYWVNGQRRWASGTEDGKAAAQRAANASIAAHDQGRGVDRDRSRMRLDVFLDEWLQATSSERRPSTDKGYQNLFDVRVKPRLGATVLRDLDAGAIEKLKAALLRSGGRRGDGLSAQSVKNTLRALGRALADAERWGWIQRNPVRGVRAPSGRKPEMRTWSADEVRQFLAGVGDDPLAPVFGLALSTGLRRGELCALRWSDVDLDRGQLSVRRARVAAGYEVHEGEPKSGRARTVALGPGTVAMLREHRRRQLEAHLALGLPRPTLVVTREDGTDMHPQSLTYYFDQAVEASGLPRIRFHDCRHTAATLLLEAGEHPKVVQERLGHSSIQITLDTYSHVTEGMQERAAGLIDDAVYGGRP